MTASVLYFQRRKQGRLIVHFLKHGDGAGNAAQRKIPNPIETLNWRSFMNIKSLLLGSAAALAVVSGAQ
ncbi:hypothetical protein EOD29_34275, partial [Mesorhizobium sp. M1A.T.Ca.IN.004.03.1.1]